MFKRIIFSFLVILVIGFTFVSCDSDKGNSASIETSKERAIPLTLENFGSEAMQVTIDITREGTDDSKLKYSVDGEEAKEVTSKTTVISLPAGKTVSLYDDRTSTDHNSTHYEIMCDAECYVYGNIMSLINSTDFKDLTSLENYAYVFDLLFYENTNIKNHPTKALVLPATKLAEGCYNHMFERCTGLTRAPELPAKELATGCYSSMFVGCSGLKEAPELPATQLEESCYYHMFQDCTSLEKAPKLPAKELKGGCYMQMFDSCTSLTEAPVLPAKTLVSLCYYSMFSECSNLSSVTCLATDIAVGATTPTEDWLLGVASSGTFIKSADAAPDFWATNSTDGVPNGWVVENNK
ncbi:MAG: hypothetical protein IJ836_08795 [Spirochaetales bacterium]|nr:hypothetical protein [Spirochaetales bacterium]